MVYFPSIVLFIKMLESCLVGPNKTHIKSIEDLLSKFIEDLSVNYDQLNNKSILKSMQTTIQYEDDEESKEEN